MNVTTKQIISLLLMTATMAVILLMMPEQPAGISQIQAESSHLASPLSR